MADIMICLVVASGCVASSSQPYCFVGRRRITSALHGVDDMEILGLINAFFGLLGVGTYIFPSPRDCRVTPFGQRSLAWGRAVVNHYLPRMDSTSIRLSFGCHIAPQDGTSSLWCHPQMLLWGKYMLLPLDVAPGNSNSKRMLPTDVCT
jgi:hypothetical protein